MTVRTIATLSSIALAGFLAAGCANDGSGLSTASVAPEKTAAAMPKVDPACATLASQIDGLRNEGSVERLEKAATGKTSNVQVKRASLMKQAELNKAYGDYQAKCGPKLQSASITPAPIPVAPIPAASASAPMAAKVAPIVPAAKAAQ
jgi:outer membrane murein-binding lipoprotein Lpp